MDLWTIGYEKAGAADFLRTLQAARVKLVCDVRDLPLSRRAGFSKRQLAAGLDSVGIGYIHIKALGTPKAGRIAHRSRDLASFWSIYEQQLATPEAQAALQDLARLAAEQPVCLVCFEADWHHCHRTRIVEKLSEQAPIEAHHLTVQDGFFG